MPKKLPWIDVAVGISTTDGETFLESLKTFRVTRIQTSACTFCVNPVPHAMRYTLLVCNSSKCRECVPYANCPWRGKVLACEVSDTMYIFELNQHFTIVNEVRKKAMTPRQKTFCKDMATQGLKPGRILNAMKIKLQLANENIPRLRSVQNFVNYYSRKTLGYNDDHDKIEELVHQAAFTGSEDESQTFTFGWDVIDNGKPFVGDGSDEEPFLVGFTSKTLLRRMDRSPDTFVFHMDATFKLNQKGFPVIVIGISDRARKFHLVAMATTSQITESMYTKTLAALRRTYTAVTGKQLAVKYVMGDADDGQYNAVEKILGKGNICIYITCFFHVLKKVFERTKSIDPRRARDLISFIYDLHFCQGPDAFITMWNQHVPERCSYEDTKAFTAYFQSVWLNKKFRRWQCFHTPSSFATTNNPVEQFNRLLKRDYTLRARLKMGALIQKLLECCNNEGAKVQVFSLQVAATEPLKRRAKEMTKRGLLVESSNLSEDSAILNVISYPAERMYVQSKTRTEETLAITAQMGVHYARMELDSMPLSGWPVNVVTRRCPCFYSHKFGMCVHILFAIGARFNYDVWGKRGLVDRNPAKKRKIGDATRQGPGRPLMNQHALSLI